MLLLREVQMLQTLHRSLAKSIPESLKVYGSIFHINRGNPFNLEVLVDFWPDYQTVITRPQREVLSPGHHWTIFSCQMALDKKVRLVNLHSSPSLKFSLPSWCHGLLRKKTNSNPNGEMTDDMDHYTNTYHIFTKTPERLPEILESNKVINWDQMFNIQGCQQGLNEKIQSVAASKSVQIDYSKRVLYITEDILQLKSSNKRIFRRSHEATIQNTEEFRSEVANLKPAFLDVSHSELVNNNWKFGKNEKSLRYIKNCIQKLPGYCLLNPEGNPISWGVMEVSCELRMAYTLSEYRGRGILGQMMDAYMKYLQQNKIPFYLHVEDMNENSHKAVRRMGFNAMPCDWHQWKSIPPRLQQLSHF